MKNVGLSLYSSIKTHVGNSVVDDLGVIKRKADGHFASEGWEGLFIYNKHGKREGKQYLDLFFYFSWLSSLVKIMVSSMSGKLLRCSSAGWSAFLPVRLFAFDGVVFCVLSTSKTV